MGLHDFQSIGRYMDSLLQESQFQILKTWTLISLLRAFPPKKHIAMRYLNLFKMFYGITQKAGYQWLKGLSNNGWANPRR